MSNAETVEQSEHVFFFVFDEQKKKYGLLNVMDSKQHIACLVCPFIVHVLYN